MRKEEEPKLRIPDDSEPITFDHAFALSQDSRPGILKQMDKPDKVKEKRDKFAFYAGIRLKAEGMVGIIDSSKDATETEIAKMTYREWETIFSEALYPAAGIAVNLDNIPKQAPDLSKQLADKRSTDLLNDFFKKLE